MEQLKKLFFICILLPLIFGCSGDSDISNDIPDKAGKEYYGVEINGVLCGFVESTVKHIEKDGKKIKQEERDLFIMLTLLGSNFNTEMKMLFHVDPSTDDCDYYSIDIKQGEIKRKAKIEIKSNTAIITSFMSEKPTEIKMTPDIIFGEDELFKNLKKDFTGDATKEKTYRILDPMDAKIRTSTFTKLGTEKIKIVGKTYNAVILNQFIKETGVKSIKVDAADKFKRI